MELTLFMPPSRDPRPAPMPPPTSGIAALDALLRVHEPLRALPADVVHIVRRFADAPLLVKLMRAMQAQASGASLDHLMQQHDGDAKLDARDLTNDGAPESRCAFERRLYALLKYAAQVGSACAVEWILKSSPLLDVKDVLFAAATHGHIAVLELPCVRQGRRWTDVDRRMRAAAAQHGQLEMYQWLFAHPPEPNGTDRHWAVRHPYPPDGYDLACAASHGQLAILQWAYAARRDEWKPHVLKHAALSNQQHVMEWIYAEDIETDVPGALTALAYPRPPYYEMDWKQRLEAIVWLHDKYPALSMSDTVLGHLDESTRGEISKHLVAKYPERYVPLRFRVLRCMTDRRTTTRKTHWWNRVASWIGAKVRSRRQRRNYDHVHAG